MNLWRLEYVEVLWLLEFSQESRKQCLQLWVEIGRRCWKFEDKRKWVNSSERMNGLKEYNMTLLWHSQKINIYFRESAWTKIGFPFSLEKQKSVEKSLWISWVFFFCFYENNNPKVNYSSGCLVKEGIQCILYFLSQCLGGTECCKWPDLLGRMSTVFRRREFMISWLNWSHTAMIRVTAVNG